MEITTEQGAAGWLTAWSAGIENGEVVEAVGSSVEQLERLSMDDMLQLWVGEFGRAQLRHFVLVSLAWSIEGLQSLVMIFADRQPSWQCRPHTNASGDERSDQLLLFPTVSFFLYLLLNSWASPTLIDKQLSCAYIMSHHVHKDLKDPDENSSRLIFFLKLKKRKFPFTKPFSP